MTFETDLPRPTRLVVEVGDVSDYGGAALKIVRDGETVVERSFPDPDGERDTATLKKYAGEVSVEIPAGRHRVTVENPGQDWFVAGYRLVGALESAAPPLLSRAVVGRRTTIVWARNEDLTWQNVTARRAVPPVPPSFLGLTGLAPGHWRVERWDTWTGRIVATTRVAVGSDGRARLALPEIAGDVALKLSRTP